MNQQVLVNQIYNATHISEINLSEVQYFLNDDDFLVRCDVLEALARFVCHKEIESIIAEKLFDQNYLVRCEACDALYMSNNIEILYMLFNQARRDKSSTVRMYAVSSMVNMLRAIDFPDDLADSIKIAYRKEKVKRVVIAYLVVMYVLEDDIQYIYDSLEYLNDENYHIRCNVINSLSSVVDDEDVASVIKEAYKERLVLESSIAVKSTLSIYV